MKNVNRIYSFRGKKPDIAEDVFIAPDAVLIGDISIGSGSSVWFQSVIRGDVNWIRVGKNVNIQDQSMLHVTSKQYPLEIGNGVTVAHKVLLHGCILRDSILIGMGSIVMDGAEIGDFSIVGAGSLVTSGKKFPPGSMILGSPAKRIRDITEKEKDMILQSSDRYTKYAKEYKEEGIG